MTEYITDCRAAEICFKNNFLDEWKLNGIPLLQLVYFGKLSYIHDGVAIFSREREIYSFHLWDTRNVEKNRKLTNVGESVFPLRDFWRQTGR